MEKYYIEDIENDRIYEGYFSKCLPLPPNDSNEDIGRVQFIVEYNHYKGNFKNFDNFMLWEPSDGFLHSKNGCFDLRYKNIIEDDDWREYTEFKDPIEIKNFEINGLQKLLMSSDLIEKALNHIPISECEEDEDEDEVEEEDEDEDEDEDEVEEEDEDEVEEKLEYFHIIRKLLLKISVELDEKDSVQEFLGKYYNRFLRDYEWQLEKRFDQVENPKEKFLEFIMASLKYSVRRNSPSGYKKELYGKVRRVAYKIVENNVPTFPMRRYKNPEINEKLFQIFRDGEEILEDINEKSEDEMLKENLDEKCIIEASKEGLFNIVKFLLKRGVNPNIRDKCEGVTAATTTSLIEASKNNHQEIVKLLLDNGANIDMFDDDEYNPIFYATIYENIEMIKILLDRDADHSYDYYGNEYDIEIPLESDLLTSAIHLGSIESAEFLLTYENGSYFESESLDFKDGNGDSALHKASEIGSENLIKLLLENDADPDIQNWEGETILMQASSSPEGGEDVVRLLLKHNADPNIQDKSGMTALMKASDWGLEKIVQLLLEHNADPNIQNKSGWTALMYASNRSRDWIPRVLLGRGADLDIQEKSRRIASMEASNNICENIVRLLLESGADPDIQDKDGDTALMWANTDEIKELLLSGGLPGPKRAEK